MRKRVEILLRKLLSESVIEKLRPIRDLIWYRDWRKESFKSFGNQNPDITFYVIRLDQSTWGRSGFFSQYFMVLRYILIAELKGMIPIVDMANYKTLFNEDSPINGTNNSWEYYFKQPTDYILAEVYKSKNVILTGRYPPDENTILNKSNLEAGQERILALSSEGYIPPSDQHIALYYELISKFIRLNATTQALIFDRVKSILNNKKTLGIHVRGSSFRKGILGHPVAIEPLEYITEAKSILSKYRFEQIFLATDEANTVKQFQDAFGNMVVCYDDITRLKSDSNFDDLCELTIGMRDSRAKHRYLMGLEVLTDVYTLSECHGLIAGSSNVSFAAVYINGGRYEYKHFIYKGIYGIDVPHIGGSR